MEHEGSLPHSQESATCPNLSQSNPVHTAPERVRNFFLHACVKRNSGVFLFIGAEFETNIASLQEQSQSLRYDQTNTSLG